MKNINIGGKKELQASAIAAGCMRLGSKTPEEMVSFIHTAQELGINFFDHADIYAGGNSEKLFGEAMKLDPTIKREDIMLQSKCDICSGYLDMSKEYILKSVDGILSRLQTDYLDILLMHRPDALVEPEEVAEAFDILEQSGKVRHFGVSNHRPMQIELLKKYVKQPLLVNQLQFSIAASGMIAGGLEANMETPFAADHDGSVMDYSRLNDMTIQAWSPYQIPGWKGCFIGSEDYPELNQELDRLAEKYGVTPTGIATAWILRHPAGIQVITGTASEARLKEIAAASEIKLTRPEWYSLFVKAGHMIP